MTILRHASNTCLLGLTLSLAAAGAAQAAAVVGQPAPDFSAVDVNGKTVKLSDYKGKQVVLEWVNPGCPFVQKHYDSGNMQGTQRDAAAKQVVWLAINSTDKGHVDYRSPAEMAKWMQGHKAAATDTLMDADGTVGKTYGARTTPHMYIVDAAGKLVYAGGIDSKATANPADIAGATNYVKVALAETTAGKPISTATSRPYGCSVKYGAG